MTELLHDGDAGACDGGRGALCVFRRTGEIILAREQEERAYFSIDLPDLSPEIAVDPVEIEVSLEHPRPALLVRPQRLGPGTGWALRRHQAGHQRGADFPAM